jgi:hypothetical protein
LEDKPAKDLVPKTLSVKLDPRPYVRETLDPC